MAVHASYVSKSAFDPEPFVIVPPDLWFPTYAEIEVEDEPKLSIDLTIKVVFDSSSGRYVADMMTIRRRAPKDEINSVALRQIPMQEYMRALGRQVKIVVPGGKPELMPDVLSNERAAEIKEGGPGSDETLRWVARIYRMAYALNQPPGKAVQTELRLTAPTASVWIRRARDRGLLTDPNDSADWRMSPKEFARARRVLE